MADLLDGEHGWHHGHNTIFCLNVRIDWRLMQGATVSNNREKHVFINDNLFRSDTKEFLVVDYDGVQIVKTNTLWFQSAAYRESPRDRCMDSAAIALIYLSMRENRNLVLHGVASTSLAENLEEFQSAWVRWCPKQYKIIDVSADEWGEQEAVSTRFAVCAFSGGVDGSFTAWRHIKKTPGKFHKDVRAAMLVQGFDIPLDADKAFAEALSGVAAMLEGLERLVVVVRTNLRDFLPDWEMNFGAGIAACLHTLAASYAYGLIGSDEAYDQLVIPWGSNPITTPLLTSSRFKVIYDGTGYTRTERCKHIGNWPGAMQHLRVCWEGPMTGGNCCKCEKCIRTILNFRAACLPKPEAFAQDISDDQIRTMAFRNRAQAELMKEIYLTAKDKGMQDPWIDVVRNRLAAYEGFKL